MRCKTSKKKALRVLDECVKKRGKNMTSGVFSNMAAPARTTTVPAVQNVTVQNQANTAIEKTKKQKFIDTAKKAAPIVLPLVAIPVTALITYNISNKNTKLLKETVDNLSQDVLKLTKEVRSHGEAMTGIRDSINTGKAADAKMWAAIIGIAGITGGAYKVGKLSDDKDKDKDKTENNTKVTYKTIDGVDTELPEEEQKELDKVIDKFRKDKKSVDDAISDVAKSDLLDGNNLGKKYLHDSKKIQLLTNETPISPALAAQLQEVGKKYLLYAPEKKPITSEHPCLWSVTSEFQPIKEGGLGSVPLALQNNIEELGVKLPTFIPMYLQKGVSALVKNGDNYVYSYKDKIYDVKKVASFQVDTFQGGKSKTEDVDIFLADDNGKQLVFIKNDTYFNGSIYSTSAKSEEPEKFAFFSKAVYEFAKLRETIDKTIVELPKKDEDDKKKEKAAGTENADKTAENQTAEGEVKAADTQPADGEVKAAETTAQAEVKEGEEKTATEDETAKAAENAEAAKKEKKDDKEEQKFPSVVKNLVLHDSKLLNSIPKMDGLILNDWQASPIAALVRYKAPVEKEFRELDKDVANKLSNINIITIGHNATYQGSTQCNNNSRQRREATSNIINTLFDKYAQIIVDNSTCGASDTDKTDPGLKNLDNVLILNKDNEAENHTNLLNMGICLSDYFCPVSDNYAKELISDKHANLSYELQWALKQKYKSGSMRGIINGNDFKKLSIEGTEAKTEDLTGLKLETYKRENTTDEIIDRRIKNKINLYNNYIKPFAETKTSPKNDLTFVDTENGMTIPNLSDEELKNTPIIASCGRLVSQKGIDILSDAIRTLYNNWDKDFKGKPKPIFYLAGDDNPNDAQSYNIINLKNKSLSKEDSDRVIFAKGYAPMAALTASSDFFVMSSKFEPCGLTQSESLALGTPVIATAVGGIVDTLNRNGKNNAILTTPDKDPDSNEIYEAMKKALTIFYDNPEKYKQMVRDSIDEDFSWIQPGKKGPCYDYLDIAGLDINKLPDVNQ